MDTRETKHLSYTRSRFVTRLPLEYLYSASHYWLAEQNGLWRVGLTSFGTRMLGEVVDYGFEVPAASAVSVGQALGWVEGFKALQDVLSVFNGTFEGANPALSLSPVALDRDCYRSGWLYQGRGTPDARCTDAHGYKLVLDAIIDKLLESRAPPEE